MRSNAKLLRLFNRYNKRYFKGRIRTPVIFYGTPTSGRQWLMGQAHRSSMRLYKVTDGKWKEIGNRPRIVIHGKLRSWGAVTRMTLLHEMAHLALPVGVNHGPRFHKEMRRLARLGAFEGSW